MTREEFAKLAAAMKTYYPRDNVMPTKEAMSLWYDMLSDLDYGEASLALKRHVSLSSFAPAISDIRKAVEDNREAVIEVQSMDAAWGDIIKAVHRYGYMREAEALCSLKEPCRTIVKRMGWQNICLSEDLRAERAFFRDSYNPMLERMRKEAALPLTVKSERKAMLDEKVRELIGRLPGTNQDPFPKKGGEAGQDCS